MKDAGFTLTETLAAMLMLGLASAGLLVALHALGVQQDRTRTRLADAAARRAAEVRITRLLADGGAFRAQDPARFAGAVDRFSFDCAAPAPCLVRLEEVGQELALVVFEGAGPERRLPLRREGPARFEYVGTSSRGGAWPPSGPERQSLRAVTLSRGRDADRETLLQARIWQEQPPACAFDVVVQDCR